MDVKAADDILTIAHNLDVEDIRQISKQLGKVTTPGTTARKFRKNLRDRFYSKISSGTDDKGFNKLLEITENMNEVNRGQLFADWGRRNVDSAGEFKGIKSYGEKLIRLNVGDVKINVRPDNIIEFANHIELSEFKHIRPGASLDSFDKAQLEKYFNLFEREISYNNKPIQRIKYIFSNYEAAEKNFSLIDNIRRICGHLLGY